MEVIEHTISCSNSESIRQAISRHNNAIRQALSSVGIKRRSCFINPMPINLPPKWQLTTKEISDTTNCPIQTQRIPLGRSNKNNVAPTAFFAISIF